jgi:hypothetical protein
MCLWEAILISWGGGVSGVDTLTIQSLQGDSPLQGLTRADPTVKRKAEREPMALGEAMGSNYSIILR